MNSDMLTRITRYYRALNRLRSIGLEKVFAHNLADAAGVNAVLVRKDFSLLNIHGQKRGGYDILPLINKLGIILGKGAAQNAIIVGCGRIGKALMNYSGFEPDGIKIVAGFDTDPLVYSDAANPIPLYPMNRLDEVIEALDVKVAILTVPENAAADCFQKLIDANIQGVLNFSPVTLKSQNIDGVMRPVVHNINIALELEQIFYEIQSPKKASSGK